ncbi:MAG: metalloregulator ArsR/SmtB family transcription factor [Paracoccaceae bacterium]|nr:metalloregulator ArsR/SmtB family transcription factor [Paracoccaceae bacterium]
MQKSKALEALSALANPTRLDLVRALMPFGTKGLSAGEIARMLDMSASRLSFHLSALEQASLISSRKAARHVFYAIDTQGLGSVIGYLLNDCCGSHPEISACCLHPNLSESQTGLTTAEP